MMSRSLVSVLMPAYNHERYVAAAVESVLSQTYPEWELIVIDDASQDGTWEVLQSFEDERLRLYRHDSNQGAHATLNEALGMARGEFVAIINSDDVFAPARIAACLETLHDTGADLVGSNIVLIDAAGEPVVEHWWVRAFSDLKRVWTETGDWHATMLHGNLFMTTSNCVFRRSWLEAVGDFRDLRYVLDYEWLLRGLIEDRRLAWLDAPLLHYRLHESNTISERPLAANLECAAMLRALVPQLLGANALERMRLEHLTAQWARIEQYQGEIWATLRHEALAAKEAELFPLIARQVEWIADRDRWIAERDGWIAEREQLIARQVEWIADRDRWVLERDARIAADQAALALCREENALLEASTSYRLGRKLTAPVRWLRGRLARWQ
ncbi:MAG TPA: glycosyltransferase [Thiobacillus sp.]|nr:glycosyltransferase [Thiobacillus sp.]